MRWLAVVEFEGLYEVSDLGNVRSLDRHTLMRHGGVRFSRGQPLKPFSCKGYPFVTLCKDQTTFRKAVHHLVLEAFVGPRPDGMEALHSNRDISDPALTNLRWGTHSENTFDAVAHGTHPWLGARWVHNPYASDLLPEPAVLLWEAPPG